MKVKTIDENDCTGTLTSGWCCPKHKLVDGALSNVIAKLSELKEKK